MCLAIPAKVMKIEGSLAEVDIEGIRRNISLCLTPEATIGEYVLLHAGFAIKVLDLKEAQETLDLMRQINAVNS